VKTIRIEEANLGVCIQDAQQERVLITRGGIPVAIIVGIEGLDEEQLQLGQSEAFWKLIAKRRGEQSMSRQDLERRISES
jgi:antitoxin (DNA-binding transcriptional repressor) of toxin-antitoxin stability system